MEVDKTDLEKILDILQLNCEFHIARDEMNSKVHRAPTVRYSPITTETQAAMERLTAILFPGGKP